MSKDGGHAFPNTPDMNVDGGRGMSLLDYFAASVINAVAQLRFETPEVDPKGAAASIARMAYEIADAMLKENINGHE